MKRIAFACAIATVCAAFAATAGAHGGGLNAEGCHNNRKTGDYHCHRAPAPPRPAPARPQALRSDAATAPEPAAPSQVYYRNCTAARATGAAPVRRGEPGYGTHLDRDGDGVGCE